MWRMSLNATRGGRLGWGRRGLQSPVQGPAPAPPPSPAPLAPAGVCGRHPPSAPGRAVCDNGGTVCAAGTGTGHGDQRAVDGGRRGGRSGASLVLIASDPLEAPGGRPDTRRYVVAILRRARPYRAGFHASRRRFPQPPEEQAHAYPRFPLVWRVRVQPPQLESEQPP